MSLYSDPSSPVRIIFPSCLFLAEYKCLFVRRRIQSGIVFNCDDCLQSTACYHSLGQVRTVLPLPQSQCPYHKFLQDPPSHIRSYHPLKAKYDLLPTHTRTFTVARFISGNSESPYPGVSMNKLAAQLCNMAGATICPPHFRDHSAIDMVLEVSSCHVLCYCPILKEFETSLYRPPGVLRRMFVSTPLVNTAS